MSRKLVVGVDFDNTIISYDNLIRKIALEQKLIGPEFKGGKKEIRDAIRTIPNGDIEWQKIQAQIYGSRIAEAKLIEGVIRFFRFCAEQSIPVYIISHKTEYSYLLKGGVNLREAALGWMNANGFFNPLTMGLKREQIYFTSSLAEKIETIKKLNCTHFIDDLEEVFAFPGFPSSTQKILFHPHRARDAFSSPASQELVEKNKFSGSTCSDWNDLFLKIFSER